MGFLDSVIPGIGAVSSLVGLLGASAAQRRAEEERQRILNQMASQNDAMYENTLGHNFHTLEQTAGLGGDALIAQGRHLGDALAGAGVYNSSATAGALANQANSLNANLLGLSENLQNDAWRQRAAGQQQINDLRYGGAMGDLNYQRQNYQSALSGTEGYLGSLAYQNLTGQNKVQPRIGGTPASDGGYVQATPGQSNQTDSNPNSPTFSAPQSRMAPAGNANPFLTPPFAQTDQQYAHLGDPSHLLGALNQQTLAQLGLNNLRMKLPVVGNGLMNQAPNLWGNAGW